MRFLVILPIALAVGCSTRNSDPPLAARAKTLEQQVEEARQSAADAVATYVPTVKGRIDELDSPTVKILRQLPGVADVEVLVMASKPDHRIIHLRDWHYVSPALFAFDVRQQVSRALSDEEVDSFYRKHLLEVELVQLEQAALLRCLVKHHGLRSVLVEGLTPRTLPNYREVIAALRDMDEQLNDLRKKRAKLKADAPAIDRQIEEMVRDHRGRLLEYGASGQLELTHEVEAIPLDDDQLLQQAKPVPSDGKVKVDPVKLEPRQHVQIRAALASGPCSFIILGGGHDLSASVRQLGGRAIEYVRVTTKRYREITGEE